MADAQEFLQQIFSPIPPSCNKKNDQFKHIFIL